MRGEASHRFDEGIVLGWGLSSDAEVLRRQSLEVRGIAYKDVMLFGKVFLQFCRAALRQSAQHEVRLSGLNFNSLYLAKSFVKTLCFFQVGTAD